MLLLLLAHTSRCEPCKSLLGSLATAPLVDFHHRRTACPSYHEKTGLKPVFDNSAVCYDVVRHKGPDRLLRFACRLPPRLPSRSPSDHSLFDRVFEPCGVQAISWIGYLDYPRKRPHPRLYIFTPHKARCPAGSFCVIP